MSGISVKQVSKYCNSTVLVSVIIPCYNHARYLGDAIESVLIQNHTFIEIIVVDDGSTDNSSAVAKAYPQVRYIRQANLGLSAARNTGWRHSKGEFLVFLDADDRLLPGALAAGLNCFQEHPECAFVSGHFRYITAEGTFLHEYPQMYVENNHYRAFLQGNYIGMHAAVMYRRSALEETGGFDANLRACEDYDLYLRIARNHPVCCHRAVITEYRQHNTNMSGDFELMLKTVLAVLQSQKKYVKLEKNLSRAFRTGIRNWTAYYGKRLGKQLLYFCKKGDMRRAGSGLLTLVSYAPYYFLNLRMGHL